MLFDLRARGRRRTVKVVYLLLALLLGGGLIFFGVGGATNGGLLNAINNDSSGGGSDQLAKDAQRLEQRIRRNPANKHLWAELAQTQFQDATSGGNYDSTTGAYTKDGLAKLQASVRSWDRYMASKPAKPDDQIAGVMVQALGTLGHYAKAATAAEIVTEAQPSSGTFQELAKWSWAAGQQRKGDLAAQKAISLAPKDQRNTLKSELDQIKSTLASQTGTDTTSTTTSTTG